MISNIALSDQSLIICSKLFDLFTTKTEFKLCALRRVRLLFKNVSTQRKKCFAGCRSGWNTKHISSQLW